MKWIWDDTGDPWTYDFDTDTQRNAPQWFHSPSLQREYEEMDTNAEVVRIWYDKCGRERLTIQYTHEPITVAVDVAEGDVVVVDTEIRRRVETLDVKALQLLGHSLTSSVVAFNGDEATIQQEEKRLAAWQRRAILRALGVE